MILFTALTRTSTYQLNVTMSTSIARLGEHRLTILAQVPKFEPNGDRRKQVNATPHCRLKSMRFSEHAGQLLQTVDLELRRIILSRLSKPRQLDCLPLRGPGSAASFPLQLFKHHNRLCHRLVCLYYVQICRHVYRLPRAAKQIPTRSNITSTETGHTHPWNLHRISHVPK